jgi:hypothetical protein
MLYTLEDYFVDFQERIHPRPFIRLMGLCYTHVLAMFIRQFLNATCKPGARKNHGVAKTNYTTKIFSEKARRKACRRFQSGLDTMFDFFDEQAKDRSFLNNFYSMERTFKNQIRLSDFVGDLTWKAPVSIIILIIHHSIHHSIRPISSPFPNVLHLAKVLLYTC